jgi:hypothetical protein
MRIGLPLICAVLLSPRIAAAQEAVDSVILTYVNGLRAIDNHAHPLLPTIPGVPADTDYDALPLGGVPPFALPVGLEPDNPKWIPAWRALYGYAYDDMDSAHVREVVDAKARVARERGAKAAEWALDQMGTDIMLANRVSMGPGLSAPRFRWVPFVDALMYPLNNSREEAATPDYRPLYPREEKLLKRYLAALHLTLLPATLDGYVNTVLIPTLRRLKSEGAVAYKFEAAYLRPLDFGNPTHDAAAAVYARSIGGPALSHADYRILEDFLFRTIARQAGALGLPVHIHTLGLFGGYYHAGGSAPDVLEDVFNDSTLRSTKFVLLHGGWPLTRQTLNMLGKPNVYADFSLMSELLSTHTLASVLREWIEEYPNKVLYGSDSYGEHNSDAVNWPDQGWYAGRNARRALALALTTMTRDGEVTRARAEEIARLVMRGNAMELYGAALRQ